MCDFDGAPRAALPLALHRNRTSQIKHHKSERQYTEAVKVAVFTSHAAPSIPASIGCYLAPDSHGHIQTSKHPNASLHLPASASADTIQVRLRGLLGGCSKQKPADNLPSWCRYISESHFWYPFGLCISPRCTVLKSMLNLVRVWLGTENAGARRRISKPGGVTALTWSSSSSSSGFGLLAGVFFFDVRVLPSCW